MLDSSAIYIVTRTFPESLILILLGTILLDVKKDMKDILRYGLIFGTIVTLIRMLPINFGVHTILSMISFGLILFAISKKEIVKTAISTCMTWIALALSESIYVLIVTGIFGVPLDDLMDKTTLKGALITLPSLIIAIIIVLIFNKIKSKIDKSIVGN